MTAGPIAGALLIAFAAAQSPQLPPPPPQTGPQREMVEVRARDTIAIRPDRAYLLFRTRRSPGVASIEPVWMRVPTAAEIEDYRSARQAAYSAAEPGLIRRHQRQAQRNPERAGPAPSLESFPFLPAGPLNLQNIEDGRPLIRGPGENVYLVEVVPGDYVLYGATYGSGILVDALHACMCLGTVGWTAEAGVVTDLGYFLGDAAHVDSSVPELSAHAGLGPSSSAYIAPIVATVRPANAGTPIPEALGGVAVRPAQYRAVGKFFDPRAQSISRLVPVPGILDYDRGRVIDVRSGEEAVGGHY